LLISFGGPLNPISKHAITAAAAALLMPPVVQAVSPTAGLSFSHDDWEIACDNTRTCRVAGYQAGDDLPAVSVLLTRQAGPRTPLTGEMMIGEDESLLPAAGQQATLKLAMRLNGRPLGDVVIKRDSMTGPLSASQVSALLAALPRKAEIEWSAGKARWALSDQGAAAVLLKMDEFQGRVGTPSALVRRGSLDDRAVLPALPAPVVVAAALSKKPLSIAQRALATSKALRDALRATVSTDGEENYCPDLLEDETADPALQVSRLGDASLLVSARCWRAAYNEGSGFWVVADAPPFRPVLVTTSASDHAEGTLSAAQKGRGIGDCWSSESWTWDGLRFVHTASSTTGMCRQLAAGGSWSLPTLTTTVRRAAR
jgi:hypothetical protein